MELLGQNLRDSSLEQLYQCNEIYVSMYLPTYYSLAYLFMGFTAHLEESFLPEPLLWSILLAQQCMYLYNVPIYIYIFFFCSAED
jgi:hypothetical protein